MYRYCISNKIRVVFRTEIAESQTNDYKNIKNNIGNITDAKGDQ